MLSVSALTLTACNASISRVDGAPILKAPPQELTASCDAPAALPRRALTQADVETLWRADREALTQCGLTKEALVEFYAKRDRGLTAS